MVLYLHWHHRRIRQWKSKRKADFCELGAGTALEEFCVVWRKVKNNSYVDTCTTDLHEQAQTNIMHDSQYQSAPDVL